ncbi:hypothetical protein [Adhaeribacter rhizoryzae]|uniref:Uncharacterized protein n=1 Tax=Adhaeribacter rhizoryzae TaxID=2607907 RepID=A0A5M6CXP2_9BACT|nr:hypothetical protein [Adhaeribacter rhizoryzae]KAA5539987.1 hypothetical protein F0145_23660 [Adhaeribacter rhizoryzae]
MTLESILSLVSFLVTGLLVIIFYKLFWKQKGQITSLLKDKEEVRDIIGALAFIQMNNLEGHKLTPVQRKLQAQQQFKYLPFQEKMAYVENHGTYLATRQQNEYHINLYYLHGFFVEVWHSQLTDGTNGIRIFTSKDCLAVYAELINLEI